MIDITNVRQQFRDVVDDWQSRASWIHAIAIGPKLVNGSPIRQDGITFFVTRKVPDETLPPDLRIPPWIDLPGLDHTIPTDVIAMPPFTFSSTYDRPSHGGDCIAPLGWSSIGTLGAVLKRRSDDRLFIISASHAMLDIGGRPGIDKIVCDPKGDSLPIGWVTATTDWSTSVPMIGDVALASGFDPPVVPPHDLEQTVNGIGALTGMEAPVDGVPVRFSGRNGYKSGKVLWRDATVVVDGLYRFENTFLTEALAQKGDSGAVVVNDTTAAIGIVFADNGLVTACTSLVAVADKLHLADYEF